MAKVDGLDFLGWGIQNGLVCGYDCDYVTVFFPQNFWIQLKTIKHFPLLRLNPAPKKSFPENLEAGLHYVNKTGTQHDIDITPSCSLLLPFLRSAITEVPAN